VYVVKTDRQPAEAMTAIATARRRSEINPTHYSRCASFARSSFFQTSAFSSPWWWTL